MSGKRIALILGVGCTILALVLILAVPVGLIAAGRIGQMIAVTSLATPAYDVVPETVPISVVPTEPTEPKPGTPTQPPVSNVGAEAGSLTALYKQVNPGVVNIQIYSNRRLSVPQGAGSGFIYDGDGHIVTNNHVVANADQVTVVFYNGFEAEAEIVGKDADSDLAVIRVDELVAGAHPLALGNSDTVEVGEPVVAIGNPFQLGGSMTAGIVSAVGRLIPSGVAQFSIPQAIQTDAAINPGNSGGPLLNLKGEVVGVNAQIAQSGTGVNAGVGFAIPSNIVTRVIPELIEKGSYRWPWLGVGGRSVDLAVVTANGLRSQQGAYITYVESGGPADKAGLRGSPQTNSLVGGDVVIEADGQPIADFSDLLVRVAFKKPGDKMALTVLRDGQRRQLTVTLEPRPANLGP